MKTPVLLVTHAPLGQAFVQTARHVFSNGTEQLLVLDVIADADPDRMVQQGISLLEKHANENGCLILTDIFGATPANIAKRIAGALPQSQFVSGLNLAMLLKVLNYSELPAADLAQRALEGGTQSILAIPTEN